MRLLAGWIPRWLAGWLLARGLQRGFTPGLSSRIRRIRPGFWPLALWLVAVLMFCDKSSVIRISEDVTNVLSGSEIVTDVKSRFIRISENGTDDK